MADEREAKKPRVEGGGEGSKRQFIGSIDQGTTSSRFIIFDDRGEVVASHQLEFENHYPQPG
jgi:glycerol kinase